MSTALLAGVLILEGCALHLGYGPQYPRTAAVLRICCAAAVGAFGLLAAYGLILAAIRHRKSWAWLAGIALTAAAMVGVVAILAPMSPATTDISDTFHWPVRLGLIKDAFIFWLLCWVLLTNTFAVVVGLEYLIDRRQHVTARRCLAWGSWVEGRMPVRAIAFPWNWGALGIFIAGMFLLALDINYYGGLRKGSQAAYWVTFMGLSRDMLLVAVTAEAMIFYKLSLTAIRKALI